MEAIVIIPSPSPSIASNGQTLKTRAGSDHAFAPSLSHAVANRNKKEGHSHETPSPKTAKSLLRKNPGEQTKRGSGQPGKITAKANQEDKPSSSSIDTTDRSSADMSSEVDTDSETENKYKTADPSPAFAGGTLGYLSSPNEDILFPDLPAAIPQSASLQDSLLPNLASPLTDSHPLEKQDGLDIFRDAFGWKRNSINGGEVTDTISQVSNQDKSTVSPDTGNNTIQTGTNTGQNTLMAQQLQKILSTNGAEMSIVQQPSQQHQATGLNSLSGQLLTVTDTSAQQTPPISDLAAGAVIASLSKESLSDGKKMVTPSAGQESNHPEISVKAEMPEQKVTPKSQDLETLLQDTSDHKQTSLIALTSSTDTTGNSQQLGQFSLGSIFAQNLQGGQHTAGTTGSAGSNAVALWTPSQENALINQVFQGLQNNSNLPTSKLTLKLYPEELGELKIDLQMKDGAIKANIFTQSEQVQQVLEKYIPKLRSLMEQQGLNVEDILVTNTSGNVDDHKLFQEDFANNHDFSQPGNSAKAATYTDLTFEKVFSKTTDTVSGVNVTV